MKVLIACEFSGTVRDAFIARGHDAVSCDLLPSERPGPHIQGDVLEHLGDGWDMMIAHPPCTYLSYVGMRHWNKPGRAEKRVEAMQFFMRFINATTIPMICVENPLGYPSQVFRAPDQIIHPYYFGDPFQKRTCLWLKGLLPLRYALRDNLFESATAVPKPEPLYILQGEKGKGKKIHWVEGIAGLSKVERQKARSKTFPGIARAFAEQWG
jgi:hypothetical protein